MKPAPGTEPVIMIIASLSDSARYEMLNPLFRRAFDFIREAAPAALETGRHVLEEDALTVMVNEAVMKKRENARMEVHDRFIDIHVPLSREEGFMWKERWKSLPNHSAGKRTRSIMMMRRTPLLS